MIAIMFLAVILDRPALALRNVVLAAPPGGHTFTRRDVELGRILDSGYVAGLVDDRFGTIVVLSGLKEGEQLIASDAFFLDAERRLQASHGNPAEVTR